MMSSAMLVAWVGYALEDAGDHQWHSAPAEQMLCSAISAVSDL